MRTMRWIKQGLLSPLALALVILAPGLLYPALASATETLDQSQPIAQTSVTVSSSSQWGQIFTAGVYGWLDRVSLYVENYWTSPPTGAVLTVSVQTVVGGLASGKQIGSGAIPLSAIPAPGFRDWVDVSIRGAAVTAGVQYALVLQTNNVFGSVTLWYAYGKYDGGVMAFNDGTAWRIDVPQYDFTFKTYVIPDTLDQHNYQGNSGRSGITLAQTFTAGLSGNLDRVVIYVENWDATGTLEASIQTLMGGYPSGAVIGQGSVPASSIPPYPSEGWVTIGIRGATVTAGIQYALVLRVGAGQFLWRYNDGSIWGEAYPGGTMVVMVAQGWTIFANDAAFQTYVAPSVVSAPPPPPPATITPCSFGACPVVTGNVTPLDSTARVTSSVRFQELPDGAVHGVLHFDDSKMGNFVLQGCTTDSAACRLTVTTFACTDEHAITVAGAYTPKGQTAGEYLLTLSGARGGIGTFTLTAGDYTYTLTHNGIVDVSCPPAAGVVAGQH